MTAPATVLAVIVTAMPEEAAPFLVSLEHSDAPAPHIPGHEVWRLAGPSRTAGTLPDSATTAADRDIILVRSGIGLVAAASALATCLTEVSPSLVISAGTTGGLGREVNVGDVCVSTHLAFTDADATAFGYTIGQTPGQPAIFPGDEAIVDAATAPAALSALQAQHHGESPARIHAGLMLAGNSFVTASNVGRTRELFPGAVSTDMESTALAQVSYSASIPFASIRGVSDLCGPQAGQDFHIAADDAAARSAAVTLTALEALGGSSRG